MTYEETCKAIQEMGGELLGHVHVGTEWLVKMPRLGGGEYLHSVMAHDGDDFKSRSWNAFNVAAVEGWVQDLTLQAALENCS